MFVCLVMTAEGVRAFICGQYVCFATMACRQKSFCNVRAKEVKTGMNMTVVRGDEVFNGVTGIPSNIFISSWFDNNSDGNLGI